MVEVIISEHESFEKALKRFNKKVEDEGILIDWNRHRWYEKPSKKRQLKKRARQRLNEK